jgi:hypothetical protein
VQEAPTFHPAEVPSLHGSDRACPEPPLRFSSGCTLHHDDHHHQLPEFRHVFAEQRTDALTLFATICDLNAGHP